MFVATTHILLCIKILKAIESYTESSLTAFKIDRRGKKDLLEIMSMNLQFQ